jgi:hypothetical protein
MSALGEEFARNCLEARQIMIMMWSEARANNFAVSESRIALHQSRDLLVVLRDQART